MFSHCQTRVTESTFAATAESSITDLAKPPPSKALPLCSCMVAMWLILSSLLTGCGEPNPLEVRVTRGIFSLQLQITNVGKDKIDIREVIVNDRPDCDFFLDPTDADAARQARLSPRTLNVGDVAYHNVRCTVVRARIRTSQGTFEYSFSH